MKKAYEVLQKQFGYSSFRPGQEETIRHFLNGDDTIAILPTGAGKSLCYELPAYLSEGAALIISPLLSLMEDQAARLKKNGEKRVIALNSFLSYQEKQYAVTNLQLYKFIFVSPEMLLQKSVADRLREVPLSVIAIDEAHCISQWGFDFRPDYLRIGEFLCYKNRPPLIALTATADKKVIEDIQRYLHMDQPAVVRQTLDRPNISYAIKELSSMEEKSAYVVNRVNETKGPGIIYANSRKRADEIAEMLRTQGIRALSYHAGKEPSDRAIIQEKFLTGETEWICATNAFGMGIHKQDVRQVIHEHLPASIAAYVQEVGRAGRDGERSAAVLLYSPYDENVTKFIAQNDLPDEYQIQYYDRLLNEGMKPEEAAQSADLKETTVRVLNFYRERLSKDEIVEQMNRLKAEKDNQVQIMTGMLKGERCIREYLLSYFGETLNDRPVHCCSVCGIDNEAFLSKEHNCVRPMEIMGWKERIAFLLE